MSEKKTWAPPPPDDELKKIFRVWFHQKTGYSYSHWVNQQGALSNVMPEEAWIEGWKTCWSSVLEEFMKVMLKDIEEAKRRKRIEE